MEGCCGYISKEEKITKRPFYSHEQYMQLIVESGEPPLSHDYGSQSVDEDPRMIAFFDSLIQRVNAGWFSDESSDDESPMDAILLQLASEWGDDEIENARSAPTLTDLRRLFRSNRRILMEELERDEGTTNADRSEFRRILNLETSALFGQSDEDTSSGEESLGPVDGQIQPESTENIRSLFQCRYYPELNRNNAVVTGATRADLNEDLKLRTSVASTSCNNSSSAVECRNSRSSISTITKHSVCIEEWPKLNQTTTSSSSNCYERSKAESLECSASYSAAAHSRSPENGDTRGKVDLDCGCHNEGVLLEKPMASTMTGHTAMKSDNYEQSCRNPCLESKDHCRCCNECERKLSMHWHSDESRTNSCSAKANLSVHGLGSGDSSTRSKSDEESVNLKANGARPVKPTTCGHVSGAARTGNRPKDNKTSSENEKESLVRNENDCSTIGAKSSNFMGTSSRKRNIDSNSMIQSYISVSSDCNRSQSNIDTLPNNTESKSVASINQSEQESSSNALTAICGYVLDNSSDSENEGANREEHETFRSSKGCRGRKYRKHDN